MKTFLVLCVSILVCASASAHAHARLIGVKTTAARKPLRFGSINAVVGGGEAVVEVERPGKVAIRFKGTKKEATKIAATLKAEGARTEVPGTSWDFTFDHTQPVRVAASRNPFTQTNTIRMESLNVLAPAMADAALFKMKERAVTLIDAAGARSPR